MRWQINLTSSYNPGTIYVKDISGQMKILISAIACDPHGHSEGLHGWLVCHSLASLGELWLLVASGHRAGIEKARVLGNIPDNMHFVFVGEHKPYAENRMVARFQSWFRYMEFSRAILPIARDLHAGEKFDLVHHVTYSTYRVGNPLWKLGIPFIWGPISGTEVFPLWKFGKILSPSAKFFEFARILGGIYSRASPAVRLSAKNAFHIFAAHSEAVSTLSKLRGTADGISVLSYYSFSPEALATIPRNKFMERPGQPLKILAGGNLEGRKGLAIALQGLALAKKRGARFFFRITSRGSEQAHLEKLTERLGLKEEVSIGRAFDREDYYPQLRDTDLYLLPSLREGGGLTMMEAMLAGCVPIVANCGGPGTAVTGECGVRIPVHTPGQMAEEIATAVVLFFNDRALVARMGAAASRRIARDYASENFNPRIKAVYDAAIKGKKTVETCCDGGKAA
jgi:glycosyltransferase involved in cell wall biosynthesis